MSNTDKNQPKEEKQPGIFNWFARYEEAAPPSQYEVNFPASDQSESEQVSI